MSVHIHHHQELQQILKTLNSKDHLIVPNAHFLSLFKNFYPQLATTLSIETPSMLLKTIGYQSIPPCVCEFLGSTKNFQDPSTGHITDKSLVQWLQAQQFYFWTWELPNIVNHHCFREVHRCVLIGHFPGSVKKQLCTFLENQGVQTIDVVEYNPSTTNDYNPPFLCTESASPAFEYQWIEKTKQTQPTAYGLLLPHASRLQTLFQNPLPNIPSAWLDWQEYGTLQAFSIFLKNTTDPTNFQNYRKDMEAFVKDGIPTNFADFYHWLPHQKETTWLQPYTPPTWSQQDTLGHFIQQLNDLINANPSLRELHIENLETCPIRIHRRQFFAILRKHLQIQSGQARNFLPIEDAVFLPITNAFVPMCIRTDTQQDNNNRAQLLDLAKQGCAISLHYALLDVDGNKQTPLFPLQKPQKTLEKRTIIASNARSQNGISQLHLPKPTRFSAKKWESFYMYPIATWLEEVLNANCIRLHTPANKKVLIGTWTHENLQFENEKQPRDLKAWLKHIQQRSDERWEKLAPSFSNPTLLYQWHQRALMLSQQIARECSIYLKQWTLKSEWDLPKDADYSGRIDLLANNPSTNEWIIIDFKTGSYKKDLGKSGKGLQLALYGSAVQSLEKLTDNSITLQVIQPDEKNPKPIKLKVFYSLIQWVEEVSKNGIYESIPSDKSIPQDNDNLPLAYAVTKKSY